MAHYAVDHFAAIAPRLQPQPLILLLASPHDGESLGAARAIGRVLDAAGIDFHDFAIAITPRLAAPKQKTAVWPNAPLTRGNWRSAVAWIRGSGVSLNDWEADFFASLPRFNRLSEKQLNCLARILETMEGWDG
jgi:hypothetical protein